MYTFVSFYFSRYFVSLRARSSFHSPFPSSLVFLSSSTGENERTKRILALSTFSLSLSIIFLSLSIFHSIKMHLSFSLSISFSISVHARATVCSREVKRAKWRGKQWTRRMLLGQAFFDRKYFALTKSHSRLNDELLLLLLLFLVIIPLIPPYFKLASKEPPLSTEKAFPSPSGWIILFSLEKRNDFFFFRIEKFLREIFFILLKERIFLREEKFLRYKEIDRFFSAEQIDSRVILGLGR